MLCFFRFIKSYLFRKFVIYKLESYLPKQRMKRVTEKQYTMQQNATCLSGRQANCTRL